MYGLGLIKGLGVTMRHFIESYVYDRKPWERRYNEDWLEKHQAVDGKGLFTIQYPEQKRKLPENFRFTPMLIYEDSADESRCTACGICARVCPPQCIYIRRATDDKGRPRPRINSWAMFFGLTAKAAVEVKTQKPSASEAAYTSSCQRTMSARFSVSLGLAYFSSPVISRITSSDSWVNPNSAKVSVIR